MFNPPPLPNETSTSYGIASMSIFIIYDFHFLLRRQYDGVSINFIFAIHVHLSISSVTIVTNLKCLLIYSNSKQLSR